MPSTASEWRSGSPWKPGTAGTRNTSTATTTRPTWASSELRLMCARSGPRSIVTPKTSSRFETTLPASEPRTTFGRSSETAKSAMISSGALPKLAFRKPPIPGPVCSAACSVASPISHASGTSAAAATANSVTSPAWKAYRSRSVTGLRTNDAHRSFRPTRTTLATWAATPAHRPVGSDGARAEPTLLKPASQAMPRTVLEAVLFDWGDTLMDFQFDEELMDTAFRAGLGAIGRDDLPPTDEIRAHFREHFEPLFWVPGTLEEIEYPGMIRDALAHFGVEVSDEELGRFLEAEHAA